MDKRIAYEDGVAAWKFGLVLSDCPYEDDEYQKYWTDGYIDAKEKEKEKS